MCSEVGDFVKVIVVTGAAGSIGQAIVDVALSEGLRVIAIDKRWPAEADQVGPNLLRVGLDIDEATDDIEELKKSALSWLGHFSDSSLVGLVNNAAVQITHPYVHLTKQNWLETLAVNVVVPSILTAVFRDSLVSNQGAVVNIGSVHESNSKASFAAYAASKAALAAAGRVINLEEAGKLRIFTVAPGAVDTPMLREGFESHSDLISLQGYQPLRRLATAKEIADFVIELLLNGTQLLSGSTIRLDGGIHGKLHDPA